MATGDWLLLSLATGVGAILCGLPFWVQRRRRSRAATARLTVSLSTHQAVMTVWLQTQYHLDELEQAGVSVTTIRDNLRYTVEDVLTGTTHSDRPESRPRPDSSLPQPTSPIALSRFGSLRIFG